MALIYCPSALFIGIPYALEQCLLRLLQERQVPTHPRIRLSDWDPTCAPVPWIFGTQRCLNHPVFHGLSQRWHPKARRMAFSAPVSLRLGQSLQCALDHVLCHAHPTELRQILTAREENPNLAVHHCYHFRSFNDAHLLCEHLARLQGWSLLQQVGLTELCLNAVEHGNLAISSEEKTLLQTQQIWLDEIAKRSIEPRYTYRYATLHYYQYPTQCEIWITDQGSGFDWETDPALLEDLQHGRGRTLAYAACLSPEYIGRGNQVRCRIPRVCDAPPHTP